MIGNSKTYNRIKKKISMLGLKINPLVFIYLRVSSSFIIFFLILFLCDFGYIIAPLVTFIYYLLVEFIALDLAIKNRSLILESDAIEFFHVFLVLIKGERNIRKALLLSVKAVDNELSLEFKRTLEEEKIGKSLDDALLDMKDRIPSDLVANMIISVIEANRLGNNISDSINNQLSYIEEKRNKKILTSYKTVPFRIAILCILFIFLVMLLLVLCV